jgi:2'-5' RNA ligase
LTHSTEALQYPVHMSLLSGGFQTKNYFGFEKELREICKKEKPLKVHSEKLTGVLPDRFWTGINIVKSDEVKKLQLKLQKLRNKFADKKEKHNFHQLHITFAFPAKVGGLKKFKSPVGSMIFDRITIVKKEKKFAPYRIYKHIKIS